MNYYTLQIHYHGTTKVEIEELKDLHCDTMEETAWIKLLRERLYMSGFTIRTSPSTVEFISPLRINTAYLIKQDRKYNPMGE